MHGLRAGGQVYGTVVSRPLCVGAERRAVAEGGHPEGRTLNGTPSGAQAGRQVQMAGGVHDDGGGAERGQVAIRCGCALLTTRQPLARGADSGRRPPPPPAACSYASGWSGQQACPARHTLVGGPPAGAPSLRTGCASTSKDRQAGRQAPVVGSDLAGRRSAGIRASSGSGRRGHMHICAWRGWLHFLSHSFTAFARASPRAGGTTVARALINVGRHAIAFPSQMSTRNRRGPQAGLLLGCPYPTKHTVEWKVAPAGRRRAPKGETRGWADDKRGACVCGEKPALRAYPERSHSEALLATPRIFARKPPAISQGVEGSVGPGPWAGRRGVVAEGTSGERDGSDADVAGRGQPRRRLRPGEAVIGCTLGGRGVDEIVIA